MDNSAPSVTTDSPIPTADGGAAPFTPQPTESLTPDVQIPPTPLVAEPVAPAPVEPVAPVAETPAFEAPQPEVVPSAPLETPTPSVDAGVQPEAVQAAQTINDLPPVPPAPTA